VNLNVFWGSPDSWIQERFHLSYYDLTFQLKILSLLFENIILSPAFLIESKLLHTILQENIKLVESGIIRFSFSNMNHSFIDYSLIKKEEKINKQIINNSFFSNHIPNYSSIQSKSITSFWNYKVKKAQRKVELPEIITDNLLNRFPIEIPNADHSEGFKDLLKGIVSNSDYYTKYLFFESITKWQPSYFNALYATDKATMSFLISSAIATNSYAALIFSNRALPYCFQELGVIGNIPFITKIFTQILGIKESQVFNLNQDQILRIRNLPEWSLFRNTYIEAITKIELSLTPEIVYHSLIKTLQQEKITINRNKVAKVLDNNILNTTLSVGVGTAAVMYGLAPFAVPISTAAPTFINKFISKMVATGLKTPITDIKRICQEIITVSEENTDLINGLSKKMKKT
jgi:hypothetical protein